MLAIFATSACGGGQTVGPVPVAGGAASAAPAGSAAPSPASSHAASPVPTSAASSSPSSAPSAGASAGATAAGVPFPSKPDSDPFYAQPGPFPNGDAPGTILASRSVTYAPVGGMAMPNPAWQLKFVSQDEFGAPIAAVATVVKPTTAATGVTPLEAVMYAEDSLGPQCAPSHSVTGATNDGNNQAEGSAPLQGLAQGWVVVYPDYEGPQSAYSSPRLAGFTTLDAVRAAERFAPLGLSGATPVGLTGYSGGAIAAAWAATLQHAYAPELDIVAVASGGTPANPRSILENIDTSQTSNAAFFNLILAAVFGANRTYDNITPILNAKGMAAATAQANGCVGATTDGSPNPSGHFADYTTVSDPLHTPAALALYPKITLPQAQAPTANVFVYHSQVDELIPIAGVDPMVAAWCSAGTHVAYYRGVAGDHIGFEATNVSAVYAYLSSRFGGGATSVPTGSTICN